MVGGLLITVALVGLYGVASGMATPQRQGVLVASVDLAPGSRLDAAQLDASFVELPADTLDRAFAADAAAALDGAVLLSPVAAGELLQRSAVRDPGAAGPDDRVRREFSFSLETDRALAGDLVPGETVDVLATYGTGGSAYTEVIADHALVAAVDDGAESSMGGAGRVTVTLALLDDAQVIAVAHASQVGAVTLVRATAASGDGTRTGTVYRPTSADEAGGAGTGSGDDAGRTGP